ncbi:probable E3 ubiquitin-protein ligase MID2 [Haliotis asinina]|uniref:probable E3 ubiquitin-protein ligase MID2 n=1 Tax=Haliotis asinina TaxID=109174 RepID=UPI003531E415
MAGEGSREGLPIDVSTVIQNNLKCIICQDVYEDPRGLPCLHAFCCKCLEDYIIHSVEGESKSFKCPICKRRTRPPNRKKSKETWANQFKHDFKLTSLRDELQRCVTVSTSNSKMAPTGMHQAPRHVPSAASEDIGSTYHRDDAERVQSRDITSGSIIHTTDTNILKGTDNSSQAVSGSVEGRIVLATGDQVSYDLTVLVQDEKKIILAPNYEGKSLLAITLNPTLEEVNRRSFNLEAKPIRICHLDNTVAVTTSDPNAIALYDMQDELLFQKRIQTKKSYDGIAYLGDGMFLVTTGTDVDIVDQNGKVQDGYKVPVPNVLRPDNCYVSVTPGGKMIITDLSAHALTCLKKDWKLLWQKKKKLYKNPMGTAVDSSGAVFVADHTSEVILQLNTCGSFVCNVVEKSDQFRKPSAIALDNMGYMYVICDYNFVAVVKLSTCDS